MTARYNGFIDQVQQIGVRFAFLVFTHETSSQATSEMIEWKSGLKARD